MVKVCDGIKKYQKTPYVQGEKPCRLKRPSAVYDGRPVPVRVETSTRSLDIKDIQHVLAFTPEVRMEKVAELKKRIMGGTYEIRVEGIADKMIREVILELNR